MSKDTFQDGEFVLKHSRSQIRKAGERVRKGISTDADIEIIREFSSAHIAPMHYVYASIVHCVTPFPGCISACRPKRLPTILDKLRRKTLDGITSNNTNLSKMRDIAGCRVVTKDIKQLKAIDEQLFDMPITDVFIRMDSNRDYILNPRDTGYRGLHRVFRYKDQFDVEVQLRTQLQHIWATGVEIVDLFEGTALKTRPYEAEQLWVEFFKILSDIFAYKDHAMLHEYSYYSKDIETLKQRLFELNQILSVKTKINSFSFVTSYLKEAPADSAYAIIAIANNGQLRKTITLNFFSEEQKVDALSYYRFIEEQGDDAVMVKMKDFSELRSAYPNYMDGISLFSKEVEEIIPIFM